MPVYKKEEPTKKFSSRAVKNPESIRDLYKIDPEAGEKRKKEFKPFSTSNDFSGYKPGELLKTFNAMANDEKVEKILQLPAEKFMGHQYSKSCGCTWKSVEYVIWDQTNAAPSMSAFIYMPTYKKSWAWTPSKVCPKHVNPTSPK